MRRLIALLCLTASGCGGSTTKTHSNFDMAQLGDTAPADGAMAPDQGAPDLAAPDLATPDLASQDLLPAICPVDNVACDPGGICLGGACTACGSDAQCATVYGAYVCINGGCQPGNCSAATPCASGTCGSNNYCTSCAQDSDCPTGDVCNSSGVCVADTLCGATAVGQACPGAANDKCCSVGGSEICIDATACCSDADCTNGTCQLNGYVTECRPNSCPPRTAGLLFVDPTTSAAGNGSTGCPYSTIPAALAVATNGTTVIVRGGTTIALAAENLVPFGVTLTGGTVPSPSASPFVACNTTNCPSSTTWPKLTDASDAHYGAELRGDTTLRYFNIVGPSPNPSTHFGVLVLTSPSPGTTTTVDHLRINGFEAGIAVAAAANVAIGSDLQSTGNTVGLTAAFATVSVTVAPGAAKTTFDSNHVNGMFVTASQLNVTGPAITPQAIGFDFNGQWGLVMQSASPGPSPSPSQLTNVAVVFNGASPPPGNIGGGLFIETPTTVKVRGSAIQNNTGVGVLAEQQALNIGTSLAGIDLGNAASPGGNVFLSNARSNVCIRSSTGALDFSSEELPAEGNTFDHATPGVDNVCTASGNGGTLAWTNDCSSGDVGFVVCPPAGPCRCGIQMVDTSTCTYSTPASVSGRKCAM